MKQKCLGVNLDCKNLFFAFVLRQLLIPKEEKIIFDENTLYHKQFGDTILKFQRYDYVLGQNMLVAVEKSTDNGKTYTKVTEELVQVSNEARFELLTESIGFIISTGYIEEDKDYIGFKVTQDGGKTFVNAKFNYTNPRVNLITIEEFPYYDGDTLKLKCSIYDKKENGKGYEDIIIIFTSNDNGLTWNYQE